MSRIILASGSPRRRELLAQIGLEFEVITSDAEEIITKKNPSDIVCELSKLKAMAVVEKLIKDKEKQNAIAQNDSLGYYNTVVIGADTIVYNDGKVLGKPQDKEDAYMMIKSISGKTHQVYTGVTIVINDRVISFSEKTDVTVTDMTDEEINSYIATKEPMDKAGAYGIQGKFAAFVSGISGDYNNVVGLPVSRLYHELRKAELI